MNKICAYPDCNLEADFPAPKDPRNLKMRQYFCEKHIKEFNKSWNGLKGFNENEIFNFQHGAATWNRPTWKPGTDRTSAKASDFESGDPLEMLKRTITGADKSHRPKCKLPQKIQDACDSLGINSPLPNTELKKKYHALVKQYHPDLNPESKLSDKIMQKLNDAHNILKEYNKRSV